MTDHIPPDYLLEHFPYLVPMGVTIPAGTPQIWYQGLGAWTVQEDGLPNEDDAPDIITYTRVDLSKPKAELPTEPGSVICNVTHESGEVFNFMQRDRLGQWIGVDSEGTSRFRSSQSITDWTPAVVLPGVHAAGSPSG